jgi:hypothetical protein
VPEAIRTSAIRPWKSMNNTEREMSISQGWEIWAFGLETGSEPGLAVLVCMFNSFHPSYGILVYIETLPGL